MKEEAELPKLVESQQKHGEKRANIERANANSGASGQTFLFAQIKEAALNCSERHHEYFPIVSINPESCRFTSDKADPRSGDLNLSWPA